MSEGAEVYLEFLKRAIRHPGVSLAFAAAARRHRLMEEDFNERLAEVCPRAQALSFPHMELDPAAYWQRNFFSILFLSIFEAVGIPRSRQHLYGMVLHAVRGIVTATDNILDDEHKGSVRLQLQGGKVLPNVLVMLMESGVLQGALRELSDDPAQLSRSWKALMGALFALGSEESGEEGAVEEVLDPQRLLEEIHRFRGGGLLLLAFVIPEAHEPERASAIERAKLGVNHIGLSLQILDDITDFQEDLRNRNHNMLRSWVVHHMPDGPTTDNALSALSDEVLAKPELRFPIATEQVMQMAIEMALEGFSILHGLGHPADRDAAVELIKAMFKLRGLQHLWEVYERASRQHRDGSQRPAVDYAPYFPERPAV